jgi:hypothetical protein
MCQASVTRAIKWKMQRVDAQAPELPVDLLSHRLQQMREHPRLLDLQELCTLGQLNWHYFQETQALWVTLMQHLQACLREKVYFYKVGAVYQNPGTQEAPEEEAGFCTQKTARTLVLLCEDSRLDKGITVLAQQCQKLVTVCHFSQLASLTERSERLQYRRGTETLLLNLMRLAKYTTTCLDTGLPFWYYSLREEAQVCTELTPNDQLAHLYCWDTERQLVEPLRDAQWLRWIDDDVLLCDDPLEQDVLTWLAEECSENPLAEEMRALLDSAEADVRKRTMRRLWLKRQPEILSISVNPSGKVIRLAHLVVPLPDGQKFLLQHLAGLGPAGFVIFRHTGNQSTLAYRWNKLLSQESVPWYSTVMLLNKKLEEFCHADQTQMHCQPVSQNVQPWLASGTSFNF